MASDSPEYKFCESIYALVNEDTFLWNIKDAVDFLKDCYSTNERSNCEIISSGNYIWELTFNQDGNNWDFSAELFECSCILHVTLHISLLDCEMKRHFEREVTECFDAAKTNNLTISKFLSSSELLKGNETYLHNGNLILYGSIEVFGNEIEYTVSIPAGERYFRQNMRFLLKHNTYADFTIKVQQKEFSCHKVVLAARCPYFDSLLRSDMKEKRSNLLVLEDIEADVLEQVLMYIYTSELDEISDANVVPLLEAAEKYLLMGLKSICEEKLLEYFSFGNLPNIAAIADAFQLSDIKSRSLYMYAMFTKQVHSNTECDSSEGERHSFVGSKTEAADGCNANKAYISALSNYSCPLVPVQPSAAFPPATVWIATYHINILECTRKLKFIVQNKRESCTKLLIKNEKLNISFETNHHIYKSGRTETLKIYFKLVSFNKQSARLKFEISLIDSHGVAKRINTRCCTCDREEEVIAYETTFGFLQDYLHDGSLIAKYKIQIKECSVYHLPKINREKMDFSTDFTNNEFTDMIIKVKETKFPCHRAIVASQSSILAQMIETSSIEELIELVDIEPDDFKKLLTYMYTEEFRFSEAEAIKFLPLACRFKLEHLRSVCERCLARGLNLENAVEMLNLCFLFCFDLAKMYFVFSSDVFA